jgi:hypothetical protein
VSEQAFREKKCSCVEHQSVDRLREIIKERDAQIFSLRSTLSDILLLVENLRFPGDPKSNAVAG